MSHSEERRTPLPRMEGPWEDYPRKLHLERKTPARTRSGRPQESEDGIGANKATC
jgi:hypothetical protein